MKTGTWGISHASHGDSAMTTRQPYPGACPHDYVPTSPYVPMTTPMTTDCTCKNTKKISITSRFSYYSLKKNSKSLSIPEKCHIFADKLRDSFFA